jgi:signal peptidase I
MAPHSRQSPGSRLPSSSASIGPGRSPEPPRHSLGRRLLRQVRATVLDYAPVVAVFLFARVALAEAYYIPSGSMEPTMLVGDRLWVNKLRFGPHIPFTSITLPGYAEPARGDIAVFVSPPQDPSIRITPDDITPTLVKRIVGVGGDTLFMREGKLFVNGVIEARSMRDSTFTSDMTSQPNPLFQWQRAIGINGSRFGEAVAQPTLHHWGPLVVPAGSFFMMGDNRDNSVDSRYYGTVPRANVRGRPTFVYHSYDTEAGLDFFRFLTEVRWSRLGTWIR